MRNKTKGFFTLPGEAGYEDLTLELAQSGDRCYKRQ